MNMQIKNNFITSDENVINTSDFQLVFHWVSKVKYLIRSGAVVGQ